MTQTLISHRRPLFYGLGALVVVGGAARGALAHPQPALTIPECAQASLIRSTIDPKKPDAKSKGQQAAHLQQVCEAKMKQLAAHPAPAPQAAPAPKAAPQKAPPPQAAPPQATPAQQTGNNHHSSSLFGGLLTFQSSSSSGHAAQPDRSQAPRTYAGPPPSYGTAPGGYGAAPAPGPAAAPAAPPPAAIPAAAIAPGAAVAPAFGQASSSTPATSSSASTTPLTPEQLNVFGVQLYQSLNLPACGAGVVDVGDVHAYDDTSKKTPAVVSATCMQTGATAQPIAQRFAKLHDVALPQKLKFALVRLAPDRCPSWVGGTCTLGVATQGGIVVGLSFFTRPGQDRAVEQTITTKYGNGPNARDAATCDAGTASQSGSKHDGVNRTWTLNDLTVRYRPLSGLTCDQGRVLVDGTPMLKLRDQRVAASTSEPKM